jgi:hypothetical protein
VYLLHVGNEPVYDFVQDIGMYTFPPGEPVEVKDDFIARAILEHKRLEGLVEVAVLRSRGGIQFDIDGATGAAKTALTAGRRELVARYIKIQQEDRIRHNFPPLPPSPVVQRIIEEDGVDLKQFGINPAGWMVTPQTQTSSADFDALKESNKALMESVRILTQKVEELTKPKRG